ncbi:MAG TPA: class I SAM-dependent methyltransferase [Phycisphaerales bacterium]|nr:class I SAM-dependent methyltransferase [Phycisphaerales bacterium]
MTTTRATPAPHPAAAGVHGHWPEIAARWGLVGPPLRPSREDTDFLRREVLPRLPGAPRVLILGVTPELHRLPWPARADVRAIDRARAMIDAVWPGEPAAALCADWRDMPLESTSFDAVLCDGGLHLLDPPGQTRVLREARRVLRPGGLCAFRLFVPPAEHESPRAVLDDLLARRIANVNELKMRLLMAMQATPGEGVALDGVWRSLASTAPGLDALAAGTGLDPDALRALETYKDRPARYHFVDESDAAAAFGAAGFRPIARGAPAYPLGDRCPTLIFRAGGTA